MAIVLLYRPLVLASFDPTSATALGLPVRLLDAVLYALIALAVVSGLAAVGSLLVTALLIVPASAARCSQPRAQANAASAPALARWRVVGLYVSYYYPVASGGAVVLAAVGLFGVTLTVSPRRASLLSSPHAACGAARERGPPHDGCRARSARLTVHAQRSGRGGPPGPGMRSDRAVCGAPRSHLPRARPLPHDLSSRRTGCHSPVDVVIGAAVGAMLTLALVLLLQRREPHCGGQRGGDRFRRHVCTGRGAGGLFRVRSRDVGAALVGNLLGIGPAELALSVGLVVVLCATIWLLNGPLVLTILTARPR